MTAPLNKGGHIARREGKRILAVALARRLGGIFYACGVMVLDSTYRW